MVQIQITLLGRFAVTVGGVPVAGARASTFTIAAA